VIRNNSFIVNKTAIKVTLIKEKIYEMSIYVKFSMSGEI